MMGMRIAAGAIAVFAVVVLVSAASYPKRVVGLDIAGFSDRDVLVIRTSGDVPAPPGVTRDETQSTVSFLLRHVSADDVALPPAGGTLIREVALDTTHPDGTNVVATLTSLQMVDAAHYRLSQPSEHVILFEVFPQAGMKESVPWITDIEQQLGIGDAEPAAPPATPMPEPPAPSFDPDQAGIATVDLTRADPARVLGLAATTGLLDLAATAQVATENLGELTVTPAGQSLVSWSKQTPPGELYLSGSDSEIAEFLRLASEALIAGQPTVDQYWAANQPRKRVRTSGGGTTASTQLRDDPYAGLYYAHSLPGGCLLSDVYVTLDATSGRNLYDVLQFLSMVSGISIIIDPYAFDEPFGSRRSPLPPEDPAAGGDEPGFRPAGVFDPQTGSSGTVQGNFVDVPFDTALHLILETHELEFVVYGGSGGGYSGSRYGKPSSSSGGGSDPYEKPIILITSRERLEQELAGQNVIDLYQFHYADPSQVTEMLDSFNLLPGTQSGWYIYRGGGGYGSSGGSGGGSGYGRGGGSGGSGGIGGGTTGANPGLLVYRGSTRQPVYDAVAEAVAAGENVLRVVMAPEEDRYLVTAFAR